jgi:hypothetical protein
MTQSCALLCLLLPWGQIDLSKTPPPADLVAKDVKAAPAAVVCFLEGPAVDAQGNVFFSDIAGNRILKMDTKGVVGVFRADSGRTNGNCFDALGRLISCEGGEQGVGRRRMVRTDMKTGATASVTTVQTTSALIRRAASGSPIRATATAATWRWTSKACIASTPTAR